MREIANFRLVTAIELEPWRYDRDGYAGDWAASVARYGIVHVKEIADTLWVRALDFEGNGDLEGVIRCESDENGSWSLFTGFAIFDGPELVLEPQCCSEFTATLDDWQEALEAEVGSELQVYIGHPWLNCERHADFLDCQLDESDLPPFRVRVDQIGPALALAHSERERFAVLVRQAALSFLRNPWLAELGSRRLLREYDEDEAHCVEVTAFFGSEYYGEPQLTELLSVLERHGLRLAEIPMANYGPAPAHTRTGDLKSLWEHRAKGQMWLRLNSQNPIYDVECDHDNRELMLKLKCQNTSELERFWSVVSALGGPTKYAVTHSDWLARLSLSDYEERFPLTTLAEFRYRTSLYLGDEEGT